MHYPNQNQVLGGLIVAEHISSEERSLLALKRVKNLGLLWASFVTFILLIQAYFYNGLYARIAEWQFSRFDTLFPFSSLALTVFVLTLPLLMIYAIRKRRHRRLYGKPLLANRLRDVQKKHALLKAITLVMILVTIIVFLLSLFVADHSDRENYTFTSSSPITRDGPVTAEVEVLYNRLASYSQKTFFTRNEFMLAPLRVKDTDTTLNYFLIVKGKNMAGPAQLETVKGFARKTKLPGGFRVLYANSGYTVGKDSYVIHPHSASAYKRRFGLAETLARLCLWLCLALLLTFAYRRRLQRENQESINPIV